MSSRPTRLSGSLNTSPSTITEQEENRSPSTRRSPRTRTTGTLMTPRSGPRIQRSLDASLADVRDSRVVEDLTLRTPQATSTPGNDGQRTLTQGLGLDRSRSAFTFSQGSPLRTAAGVAAALGASYLASYVLPPGVSQIVTNLAHSAFYTRAPLTVPRTPTQLLEAARGTGSQLNLTNVGLAGLFAITTAASMSPGVRSAAAGAARATANILSPNRKRPANANDEEKHSDGATVAKHMNKKKRDDDDLEDSGVREGDESRVETGANANSSKSKAKRTSDISEAASEDGAGSADEVTAEELERRHANLSQKGNQLRARLQNAREASTPATDARRTRAATSALASAHTTPAGKRKAAVPHDEYEELNPNDTNPSFYTSVPPRYKNLTATQQKLLPRTQTQFCMAAGTYLTKFAYGKKIKDTADGTLIQGTPLRIMETQNEHFQNLVNKNHFRDAHEYMNTHRPADVKALEWEAVKKYESGVTYVIPTKATRAQPQHTIDALRDFDKYMQEAQRLERVLSNRNLEELLPDDSE